jgi:hypothetical protein
MLLRQKLMPETVQFIEVEYISDRVRKLYPVFLTSTAYIDVVSLWVNGWTELTSSYVTEYFVTQE